MGVIENVVFSICVSDKGIKINIHENSITLWEYSQLCYIKNDLIEIIAKFLDGRRGE